MMNSKELQDRTKKLALDIILMADQLPDTIAGNVIARQIVRSGTSVGSNYRAVCRARSEKDFLSKLGIVIEEIDETLFWLEIIQEKDWLSETLLNPLIQETDELTAIFVSSAKTMKTRLRAN